MPITLFDAFCGFGGARRGETARPSVDDLVAEMQRLGISRALARIAPEDLDQDVAASNARLYAACAGRPALVPCPIVLPSGGGNFPSEEEQLAGHVAQGCGAVWIRPGPDYWSLAPWASAALFAALAARRLPVLLTESLVTLEQVADLASRHPRLPVLLAGVSYRQQRTLLPLLGACPGVHLVLGEGYAVHLGLEQIVAEVGAERVLFGTGFPRTEAMCAITYLLYSALAEEQKQMIGYQNGERLLNEVER
jgi:hypothetical protein